MMLHQFNHATKEPIDLIAKSSGHMNNCGLHSLIHLWLALPDEIFDTLYYQYPIFQDIQREYCSLYGGVETNHKLEMLKGLKNVPGLNNVWDRELIWGTVFRNILQRVAAQYANSEQDIVDEANYQYILTKDDLKLINPGAPIDFRILRLLSQAMGFNMTVCNKTDEYEKEGQRYGKPMSVYEPLVYVFLAHQPKEEWADDFLRSALCKDHLNAELIFTGNHYDFTYPDKRKNAPHNAQFRDLNTSVIQTNLYGKILAEDVKFKELEAKKDKVFQGKLEGAKFTQAELEIVLTYREYIGNCEKAFITALMSKVNENILERIRLSQNGAKNTLSNKK